jgi:hypothetical protein
MLMLAADRVASTCGCQGSLATVLLSRTDRSGNHTAKDLREHLTALQSGQSLDSEDLQDIQAIGQREYYSPQDLNPETKYIKELLTDFTNLSEEDQITWRDKLSYFLGEHEDAWPLDGVMASWNGCDPFADVSLVDFELDRSVEGNTPERMEEEKDTDDGDEGLDQGEENKEEQADEGEGDQIDESEQDNEVPDEEGDTANNIPSIATDTAEEDLAENYVPRGGHTSLFGGDGYLLSRNASPAMEVDRGGVAAVQEVGSGTHSLVSAV